MSAAITLSRVRVIGGGVDPVTARLRLEAALGGCDLRPPGLPPAALLLVRRLRAPPGVALPLEAGGMRPPPEWEAGLVGALERALRRAARPAREAVPADAEAVLFADRAELLACLARDALDGTVWSRWWWRSALAVAGGREPVQQAWLAEPTHVPAALELLAANGVAAEVVRALPEPTAAAIADAVLRAFEVPVRELVRAEQPSSPPSDPPRLLGVPRRAPARSADQPWRALVAEAGAPSLEPEQRRLLAVALALRRAPALLRATGIVPPSAAAPLRPPARVEPTIRPPAAPVPGEPIEQPPPPLPSRPDAVAPTAPPEPGPRAPAAARREPQRAADRRLVVPDRSPRVRPGSPAPAAVDAEPPLRFQAAPSDVPSSSSPAPTAPPAAPAPARRPRAPRALPPGERPLVRPRPIAPEPLTPTTPVARTADASAMPPAPRVVAGPLASPVETGLGGVFYLLNLALHLDLYGDFTQPRAPGLRLDPWDLLALLGASLLRADPERADPLWALLGELAGRAPGEPPGRGFRPPRAWRVPPAWLEPVPGDGPWRWSAADGVLCIAHPAGFPAAAVPRTRVPAREQLRTELRRLGVAGAVRTALPREPRAPLARWVARLGAYAEARLASGLGLTEPGAVAAELLEHRAHVFVTPAHVDIELSLAELPLAIRFAGLDRTPGWIPAAGHFVAFHFQ